MLRLPELQQRFLRRVARGHAEEGADAELIREIRSHGDLGAEERLDVYARMYCARLIGALAEDHPRVAEILSAEAFADVAHRYLDAHPSTQPSLRWFGEAFGDFLASCTDAGHPDFVPDLARLEWTRLTVFDAADADPLRIAALRAVAPEQWPSLRFEVVPASRVLHVGWPVHRIWEDDGVAASWAPEDTWLRVWRQGDRVFQAPMDPVERTALDHVRRGDDFSAVCAALAELTSPEDAPRTVGALVLRWIEDELLLERDESHA